MSGFIDRERARQRVNRNRLRWLVTPRTDEDLMSIYNARHNAIVQTWAEVTDQTWSEALCELQNTSQEENEL